MDKKLIQDLFPSAWDDARAAGLHPVTPQTQSPSYRLAFCDHDFLLQDELRHVRLLLEMLKPELILNEHGIKGTIVIFGSARIPAPEEAAARVKAAESALRRAPDDLQLVEELARARRQAERSRYYDEARKLAGLISEANKASDDFNCVVATGGGPGIMEAANRGACEAGAQSIGFNIVQPFEQQPNQYVTPELSFLFHYFAIRKMHFLMRARALVVFPGGFGTFDELFEALTLIQTKKIKPIPVLIFGQAFWERVVNFDALAEEGVISPGDLNIFRYVETAEEAWEIIADTVMERKPALS